MIMMTPERQLVNPFFTGGGQISVSYPTNTMDYDARHPEHARQQPGLLARDGASRDDSRPQPRRLPGPRFDDYRANLSGGGPFFGEGWPLYWELTLYDMGFNKTPEQKSRRALLAHAPLRAHHLLAQVPHGPVVAAGGHRLPRRSRRPRARQRHGRSPPLVRSGGRLRRRSIRPRTCSAACSCAACARSSSTRRS